MLMVMIQVELHVKNQIRRVSSRGGNKRLETLKRTTEKCYVKKSCATKEPQRKAVGKVLAVFLRWRLTFAKKTIGFESDKGANSG